ncbi:hypothetical protein MCOR25_003762 [Pyricularia grisea]|nr:hypothetical protein MCOR25_003762 [Pyricularia grisea]
MSGSMVIGSEVEHSTSPVASPFMTPPYPSTVDDDQLGCSMLIRQDPFSITLDAPALLTVTLLLVLGMHMIDHHLFACLLVGTLALLLIRNDYHNFLKLGPGGTPPTIFGYARLSWYRLFAVRDPFSAPVPSRNHLPACGILRDQPLPYRPGPRPLVAGLAPQRQLDQWGPVRCAEQLKTAIERATVQFPQLLGTATSSIEKHGFALFARHPVNVHGNGEVAHVHSSDKSLHLNLHPDDIKEVLQRGWGQRHPLGFGSIRGWVESPVPSTFVMIYAPRDETDLRIVCKIVEAAIWYTAAERISLELPCDS